MTKTTLPVITVVIPAFNEEKYIPLLLTSLQKQTYPQFDVIVVDNNSTDKTSALAKQHGAKVVTETRQGYVFTLNTGMHAARGEIIAVTDADAIPAANWLEQIAKAFADPRVVGVAGSVGYKDSNGLLNFLSYPLYTIFMAINFFIGKPHLTGSSMAIRKSAFEKLDGLNFRYEISADVELGLRLKKYGKVLFRPAITVAASARRFRKDPLRQFLKYSNAYLSVVWLAKAPKGQLQPIR